MFGNLLNVKKTTRLTNESLSEKKIFFNKENFKYIIFKEIVPQLGSFVNNIETKNKIYKEK